jgi:hypothetical protein
MSRPIVSDSNIRLPRQDGKILVALVERGAAHVAFGIALFLGSDLVRNVVAFPDEDEVNKQFSLDGAVALRGMGLTCFGRVFSADPDNITLQLVFFQGKEKVASSDVANIPITATDATREFYLRCKFL